MASKKKPVTVTLKQTHHATQPWKFDIDDPGPGPKLTVKERYTDKRNCMRGALRKLDARTSSGYPGRPFCYTGGYTWFTPEGRMILIVSSGSKATTKKK